MICDGEGVEEIFKTKEYFMGHIGQEYKDSTELYSVNEFTVPEFEEKFGNDIRVKGTTVSLGYILNAMDMVNRDTIILIGDPAVNFIYTILV